MLELTEMEFDALREVGNVGVGNAATALSKVLNKKIDINLPETSFVEIAKFGQYVGGPEMISEALVLELEGELDGQAIFLFPIDSALNIVDLMMLQPNGTTKAMDEMSESAFKEMGNIVVGSYLTSLSNMLDMKIMPGLPQVANDMAQAVLDATLIKQAQSADDILTVKTKIIVEGQEIDGIFFLLFEEESLKLVLEKLKKMYGL